jgi:hypothetical protein
LTYEILKKKDVEVIPTLTSPFISGNWAAMVPLENFDESNKKIS